MAHFWPSRQTDASTGEIQCQLWTFGQRTSVLSLTLAGAGIGGGQAFFGGFQVASESSGAVLDRCRWLASQPPSYRAR